MLSSANGLADNTIIVVTSDHGWDMGQKKYLFKNTLWEDSTRVPMIIRAPGISVAGTQTRQPVSLIDLYPTLVDLCDLEGDTRKSSQGTPLDGFSMRPLLEDPQAGEWAGPGGRPHDALRWPQKQLCACDAALGLPNRTLPLYSLQ
jgi:iduronate 2-sulfatase